MPHPAALVGALVAWWAAEVVVEARERIVVFEEARATADRLGKPLLNIACGDLLWAAEMSDLNADLVPRDVPRFLQADIQDLWMIPSKAFGVAVSSHTLEHVQDPQRALAELHRVADLVYVITPRPFFPAAWVSPQHLWVFGPGGPGRSWQVPNWPQIAAPARPYVPAGRMVAVAA